MKIAFCNRPKWNEPLGGDGVQMLKTKEALESLYKVEIDIITNAEDITNKYDLVHIFNFVTTKVTYTFFERAIYLKIPIVSSSIFWDYTYAATGLVRLFIGSNFAGIRPKIYKYTLHLLSKSVGRPYLFSYKFKKIYRFFCKHSDIILPNSIEEGYLLQKFIGKPFIENKIQVVYNGVDKSSNITYVEKEHFFSKYSIPHNYILQVGRIEPVKNQINLLYALMDNKEIPIVFVGKIYDSKYFKKLDKLAKKRGNVYFIDAVPHEEIDSFYFYAKLHVLLSLRESPGLVSLEALLNNCPIVISDSRYCPVKTYFPSQPYIADPLNIKDIRKVILSAYSESKLVKDNMDSFTWEKAAQQTFDGYCTVLNN